MCEVCEVWEVWDMSVEVFEVVLHRLAFRPSASVLVPFLAPLARSVAPTLEGIPALAAASTTDTRQLKIDCNTTVSPLSSLNDTAPSPDTRGRTPSKRRHHPPKANEEMEEDWRYTQLQRER